MMQSNQTCAHETGYFGERTALPVGQGMFTTTATFIKDLLCSHNGTKWLCQQVPVVWEPPCSAAHCELIVCHIDSKIPGAGIMALLLVLECSRKEEQFFRFSHYNCIKLLCDGF